MHRSSVPDEQQLALVAGPIGYGGLRFVLEALVSPSMVGMCIDSPFLCGGCSPSPRFAKKLVISQSGRA